VSIAPAGTVNRVVHSAVTTTRSLLFARGFRPFFLLAGAFGCALPLVWVAILAGWLAPPRAWMPIWWHAHEMLFGFVTAAIAGFLLTAVPVWTGGRASSGGRLAAVVALWIAGRLAMLDGELLPRGVVAAVDLALLPTLAAVLAPGLIAARQPRNYGFVPVLIALFAANLMFHLDALGHFEGGARRGLRLAVDLVMLLLVVIGGRIVPTFTANALRRQGKEPGLRSRPWVERLTVPAVVAVALADWVAPHSAASGLAAAVAALLLAVRVAGWQGHRVVRDPLLWSLHLGYAWVPVGLAFLAASDLSGWPAPTSALHALTAGAFGTMILAVMSRVSLGHTGRPFTAIPGTAVAYALVTAGALLRSIGSVAWPAYTLPVTAFAGLLWAAAFGVFTVLYAPILTAPRVDGRAG
jgi:uncharacterized protein involved in response to NO